MHQPLSLHTLLCNFIFGKELVWKELVLQNWIDFAELHIKIHGAAIKSQRNSIAILLSGLIDFLPPL